VIRGLGLTAAVLGLPVVVIVAAVLVLPVAGVVLVLVFVSRIIASNEHANVGISKK
jgi:hypothetical protein